MTWSFSFLVSWFPIIKGLLETHGMELKSVFEEPNVLGSPTTHIRKRLYLFLQKLMYLQVYQKQLESNYMVPPSPPTLRVKCRMFEIGKCIWLGCHVVTLP
jgi:hypothetical protein